MSDYKNLLRAEKLLVFLLILSAVFFSQLSVLQAVSSNAQQKRVGKIVPSLDKFIKDFLKKKKDPGCVVAIVGPHKVYFLKAYGVKQLGKSAPLTPSTLFQLGSVSKTLTATLVLLLQAKNKLSIETPVATYLKDFKLQGQKAPLCIKHLLSHTSGVPRWGFNALIENFSSRETLFQKAQRRPIKAQPGVLFDYHNVMFSLIEDVLSASLNKPFGDILQDYLFTPLHMKKASIGLLPLQKTHDKAIPHVTNKEGAIVPLSKYSSAYYNVSASGGINACMEDLIPFLQLQLGGFPHLLPPQERALLQASQVLQNPLPYWLKNHAEHIENKGYALGWHVMGYKGERVLFHGGWVNGFNPGILFLPQHGIGLILLHHAETSLMINTFFKFLDLYLEATP